MQSSARLDPQGAISWPASPSASSMTPSRSACACAPRRMAARWRTRRAPSCGAPPPARTPGPRPRPASAAVRRRSASEQAEPAPGDAPGPGAKRVLLIIGGGIAAYKSLDLIRRLKERGAAVRCILTAAAQEFITPLAAGALAGETRVHRSVRRRDRIRRRPHPAGARDRSGRRGAGDRRPDGQDGGRPCRRSRHRGAARDRSPGADRAGHEPAHVGARRRRSATWRSSRPTASRWSARTRARWRKPARPASAAWPSRSRSWRRPGRCSAHRRRPGARRRAA